MSPSPVDRGGRRRPAAGDDPLRSRRSCRRVRRSVRALPRRRRCRGRWRSGPCGPWLVVATRLGRTEGAPGARLRLSGRASHRSWYVRSRRVAGVAAGARRAGIGRTPRADPLARLESPRWVAIHRVSGTFPEGGPFEQLLVGVLFFVGGPRPARRGVRARRRRPRRRALRRTVRHEDGVNQAVRMRISGEDGSPPSISASRDECAAVV